ERVGRADRMRSFDSARTLSVRGGRQTLKRSALMGNGFSHGGWRPSPDRFLNILTDPMYRTLVDLQDLVTTRTAAFWSRRGVKSMHLPITTGTISSPMGLGSDSVPVSIELFGQPTYLADSIDRKST